jgi:hypothetical protein
MNKKLRVSLESPQHGFMSLRLSCGKESFVTVVASEPYSSLEDLIVALSALTEGDCDLRIKWNGEPEEYDFRLVVKDDSARFDVIHYPDHRRLAELSSTVFTFRGSRLDACLPFWKELQDLRSRSRQDEFERQWRREFPERELDELTKRIHSLEGDGG